MSTVYLVRLIGTTGTNYTITDTDLYPDGWPTLEGAKNRAETLSSNFPGVVMEVLQVTTIVYSTYIAGEEKLS